MARFDGRTVLITGGAHGQGRSHAVHFAREGADVVLVDLCAEIAGVYPLGTREELDETADAVRAAGGRALAIVADVRSRAAMRDAAAQALDAFGRIDVLLNNAGICTVEAIDELGDETADAVIDVCLKGVLNATHAVVPAMKRQRFGKIINTASVGGLKAVPYVSPYAAAKGGVVLATKSWANELAAWEINVNCVAPGTVLTGMVTGLAAQQGIADADAFDEFNAGVLFEGERGHVQVEDISKAILFLASDDARMITGHVLPVDAGWLVAR